MQAHVRMISHVGHGPYCWEFEKVKPGGTEVMSIESVNDVGQTMRPQ